MDTPRVTSSINNLRDDLRDCSYDVATVANWLGPVASGALHREHVVPALRATQGGRPLDAVVRLFSLGVPCAADQVDAAFPTCGVAGLTDLGLVTVTDGQVSPLVDLRPYGDDSRDWWVCSDLSELVTRAPLRTDHVLGIGGAAMTLASWTPRRPAARALDLGTGCGVQALHLSTHCDQITATDISERALDFARFNAALNGIELDTRAGSLLEPVAGETFDLIVSNPPFVITPRQPGVPEYEYRDGGQVGDALVRNLIRDLPTHLEPGGIAQLLANWEVPAGQTWQSVIEGWLADLPVDAWVIQRETQDPAEYAELWARDGGTLPGSAEFERLYAAWLDDFASRDVAAIGFGVITLQRPTTARDVFRDVREETGPVAAPMGPAIDAGLRARTWLAERTDADVLDQSWIVAADVTEERHTRPGNDDPSLILVRQGGGLGLSVTADTGLAAYLSVCDGSMPARVALEAIASLLEVDADSLVSQSIPRIRQLVADGLLVLEQP